MKIAVFGSGGRMGKRVCVLARERGHLVLPFEATDVKEEQADVVIDFSLPQATEEVCRYCLLHRCPLVSGVTGRTPQQQKLIDDLSESVPVQAKSNFSRGIAAMRQVCRLLASLNWDCEIVGNAQKGQTGRPQRHGKDVGVRRNAQRHPQGDLSLVALRQQLGQTRGGFCHAGGKHYRNSPSGKRRYFCLGRHLVRGRTV